MGAERQRSREIFILGGAGIGGENLMVNKITTLFCYNSKNNNKSNKSV